MNIKQIGRTLTIALLASLMAGSAMAATISDLRGGVKDTRARLVMDIDESDLHLQTEETDGYMFATLDQIRAFAAEGKFLHYDSIKRAFEF